MSSRSALANIAVAGVAVLVLAAVLAPFAPHDPLTTNVAQALAPPSAAHWLGTDQLGRDLLARVLWATRLDLTIAVAAVVPSALIGSMIGAFSGLKGGVIDRLIGRVVDGMMAFPLFIIAMALVAVRGGGVLAVIEATVIINLPFYIRLARAETAARRHARYVQAARLGGSGDLHLLYAVLLPALLPELMVRLSLNLGWAVLNTAGLSFLGIGVRPPTPEWGVLVAEGAQFLLGGQWWVAAGPAVALVFAVLVFALAGDALRDRLDPRRQP